MKKVRVLGYLLLVMVLLVGCSCSNDQCKCPGDDGNASEEYKQEITDYSELIEATARSVVMIKVQNQDSKQVIATGSGVVAFETGTCINSNYINQKCAYIITNAHVVNKLTSGYEVEVMFSTSDGFMSGESEIAMLVGKDYYEDVAVLEILKSEKYSLATIGDSSSINRGDFVYTIGSPLGKFNYTTAGNISSYNVPIEIDNSRVGKETTVYAILTDAPINEGNSGGGLFDKDGKLIGITTLKYDDTTGMYGSLPINYFMKVANYLLVNNTNYVRPTLNLTLLSIPELGSSKETYGISDYVKTGVYIQASLEGNVESGTVIKKVNGVSVDDEAQYFVELLKYNIGDSVTLEVVNKDGLNVRTVTAVLHA